MPLEVLEVGGVSILVFPSTCKLHCKGEPWRDLFIQTDTDPVTHLEQLGEGEGEEVR